MESAVPKIRTSKMPVTGRLLYICLLLQLLIKFNRGQCEFGSDCIFPCRCQSGSCTEDKGTCTDRGGCQEITYQNYINEDGMFSGPTCQIGNVAYNKFAWQQGAWSGLVAGNAVDGRGYADGGFRQRPQYCAHPEASSPPVFWTVDLGTPHRIFNVTVYNTRDVVGHSRFHNIRVLVSMTNTSDYTDCGAYPGPPSGISDDRLVIACDTVGRYLRIQRDDEIYLTLCEVIVYGYVYNGADDNCGNNCENYRCRQWWTPEGKCYQYIRKPALESRSNPTLVAKTSDSLTVSFRHDDAINDDLKEYYKYYIERKRATASDSEYSVVSIGTTHVENDHPTQVTVSGMEAYTEYSLRTVLRREQFGADDVCDYGPDELQVRTACGAPDAPDLAVTDIRNGFTVSWELNNPRCGGYSGNTIIFYAGSSTSVHHSSTSVVINVEPGEYDVNIEVTNTEGFTRQSNTGRVTVTGKCEFGSDCIFPCRCQSGSCIEDKGTCTDMGGCLGITYQNNINEDGMFSGPTCQMGNVAYNKFAWQEGAWRGLVAGNAVDGRGYVDGEFRQEQQYCAHPAASSPPVFWTVDLGTPHRIFNVTVYNTRDVVGHSRFHNIRVLVSMTNPSDYTDCGAYPGPPSGISDDRLVIACDTVGRYLRIQRDDEIYLTLCEVIVYGYVYNGADDNCGNNCENNYRCRQWWTPEGKCYQYIRKVALESRSDPTLVDKTSDSLTVSLDHDEAINDGLKEYYKYYIERKRATALDSEYSVVSIGTTHVAINHLTEVTVSDMEAYTEYTLRTVLWREQYGEADVCDYGPNELQVRTACGAPDAPDLTVTDNENGFTVSWVLYNPRCGGYSGDTFIFYSGSSTSVHHTWTSVDINVVPGEYDVYIEVTNTEGFTCQSNTERVTVAVGTHSSGGSGGNGSGNDGGMIVGIVVAFLVLLIAGVIVVVILRRRKKNNGKQKDIEIITPFRIEHQNQADNGQLNSAFESDTTKPATASPKAAKPKLQPKPDLSSLDPMYGNTHVHQEMKTEVKIEDLADHIEKYLTEHDGFRQEYTKLQSGERAKCEQGSSASNKTKNRFLNICAYDHSRVVLDFEDGNAESEYINANYLNGYKDDPHRYVATQGPNSQTINDLWRMVWQLNSHRIIMITKLSEDGKAKCDLYWPDRVGKTKAYAGITVRNINVERFTDYTVRHFAVTKGEETRQLQQLHFTSWTEKSVPDHAFPLLSFRRKVRSLDDPSKGPMIVHCSAGVGRTGTFIAIDYLMEQIAAEGVIDVFKYVFLIRTQRMNMVQTLEQYQFIYLALLDFVNTGTTAVPSHSFVSHYREFVQPGEHGVSAMQRQYELLGVDTERVLRTMLTYDYDQAPYRDRNRDQAILPSDNRRPCLIRHNTREDYINAVFVDNLKSKLGYIATQMPFPHTQEDVWRLLYDHASKTIIMLNTLDQADQTCNSYWPVEPDKETAYGVMQVTLTSEVDGPFDGLIVREFLIRNIRQPNEEGSKVKQFQLSSWPEEEDCPASPKVLIDLIETVERWQQASGNTSITVHCMNGCRKTGLYCSAAYIIDKLKEEQEVDVFTSVRRMRLSRPQFIVDLDQYDFLHKLAETYLGKYKTYANFKEF